MKPVEIEAVQEAMQSVAAAAPVIAVPPVTAGAMEKKGDFRWSSRWVLLQAGYLTYHTGSQSSSPVKAILHLRGATVLSRSSPQEILVRWANAELPELLLRSTSVAETSRWREAIDAHISYASVVPTP